MAKYSRHFLNVYRFETGRGIICRISFNTAWLHYVPLCCWCCRLPCILIRQESDAALKSPALAGLFVEQCFGIVCLIKAGFQSAAATSSRRRTCVRRSPRARCHSALLRPLSPQSSSIGHDHSLSNQVCSYCQAACRIR